MRTLVIIPARGGSKGLPGKNIRPLLGKPLICWSIDAARGVASDVDICLSTDSELIANVARDYGLGVPFLRPSELASDNATTNDVLLHAVDFYASQGEIYDTIILLQPTSPLRRATHIKEAISLYNSELDMVVSVKESHAAAVICSENEEHYLTLTLNQKGAHRQDINFWEYNGAIYIINVASLKEANGNPLKKIKKYVMDDIHSIDIDNELDFDIAELVATKYQ